MDQPTNASDPSVALRTQLKPGDLGTIVRMHGVLHAQELGFDPTFEAYVAEPLASFVRNASSRERIWIAECEGQIVGCIAIVAISSQVAQLRWFLLEPRFRGIGLGKRLLHEAISFCKDCRYESIVLWTVRALTTAAHLYRAAGFRKIEEKPGRQWGVDAIEERYELMLRGEIR